MFVEEKYRDSEIDDESSVPKHFRSSLQRGRSAFKSEYDHAIPQSYTADQIEILVFVRKRQIMITETWSPEDNKSNATSSLFPNEIIAKLEKLLLREPQTML